MRPHLQTMRGRGGLLRTENWTMLDRTEIGNPMRNELLSTAEMAEADRLAIAAGPLDGYGLMQRAGEAVAT
ncbi:MAG: hypothetical protein E5W28_06500, partial [Mesorhizobium sp.]